MEVIKYQRENIQPELFMHPPTELFTEQVKSLGIGMEGKINAKLAEDNSATSAPRLQIATEIEFLIFDASFDPSLYKTIPPAENPNNYLLHKHNVQRFFSKMTNSESAGGLGTALCGGTTVDKVFAEIRTVPQSVDEYFNTMEKLQTYVSETSKKDEVLPVVYSQQFHMSAQAKDGTNNVFTDGKKQIQVSNGMLDTYYRALPLVRLPENLHAENSEMMIFGGGGVLLKGRNNTGRDPKRLEGRINNNDYAFDPYVNLLINLYGFYRGLTADENQLEIDSGVTVYEGGVLGFHVGEGFTDWKSSVDKLNEDPKILEALPKDMIRKMTPILHKYPEVSKGDMTLEDVLLFAKDLDEVRDDKVGGVIYVQN